MAATTVWSRRSISPGPASRSRWLERREQVGGAAYTEEISPGYRISTCSYVCWNLQQRIVEDLELERHGLVRHPIEPLPVLPLRDGEYLAFWEDVEATDGSRIPLPVAETSELHNLVRPG